MNLTVNRHSGVSHPVPSAADYLLSVTAHTINSVDKAWSYLGKTLSLSRYGLNAIVNSKVWKESGQKNVDARIKDLVIRLKLFSIVNVPLSVPSVVSQVKKLWNSVQWHDYEGILLSTLSIVVLAADNFDNVTTFVNALLQTLSHAPIEWISAIGIPLGLSLIGMNTISRGYRLYQLSKFLYELNTELIGKMEKKELSTEELQSALTKFLESKLGPNMDKTTLAQDLRTQIKQCNEAILERHTNSKTVRLLDLLSDAVQTKRMLTEAHAIAIFGILKDIQQSICEEIGIQALTLVAYSVSATALLLLLLATPTPLPYILLGCSILLRIGIQVYQDFKQDNQVYTLPFHTLYFKARSQKH